MTLFGTIQIRAIRLGAHEMIIQKTNEIFLKADTLYKIQLNEFECTVYMDFN